MARMLIALALVGLAGCGSEEQVLLLDTVCRNTFSNVTGMPLAACSTTGDVELVSGLSSDVTAVHFGSSGLGELRIRLNAIPAVSQPTWSLEALAASTRPEGSTIFRVLTWGSCGAACPADPEDVEADIDEDFTWVRVIDDYGGSNSASTFVPVPDDAAIIFRGSDIDLIDIRTPGFDSQSGLVPL